MAERSVDVELSVIVPVGTRQTDPAGLYQDYKAGLEALGDRYEIIFVLDGPREKFASGLRALLDGGERFTVISLSRPFGEATAIMAGFEHASGQTVVTLPAYHQIEGVEIGKLVKGLEKADLVVGHRWPRAGGPFERMRRTAFHGLLGWVTRLQFRDVGCGARAMDRRVLQEIALYGDQHRFLPVLADRQGFRVIEVDVRQSPKDRFEGTYQPREYTRVLLDLFTVFFLVRFTKKPLRFFGMVGVTTFAFGALAVTWVVIEKLFFGQALADRPALLLASLLVVLGLQLLALGLLGELMIFTHAKGLKDYQVERVMQFGPSASRAPEYKVRG
jgi:glycosyltransferase involved in cell wall biosynthesis